MHYWYTVKPVLSCHSKVDKTKVLKPFGSLMEVKSSAEWEHSAILLTCIKRLLVLKTYFWSSFEWPLKTGFTVYTIMEIICPLVHFSTSDTVPTRLLSLTLISKTGIMMVEFGHVTDIISCQYKLSQIASGVYDFQSDIFQL